MPIVYAMLCVLFVIYLACLENDLSEISWLLYKVELVCLYYNTIISKISNISKHSDSLHGWFIFRATDPFLYCSSYYITISPLVKCVLHSPIVQKLCSRVIWLNNVTVNFIYYYFLGTLLSVAMEYMIKLIKCPRF